MEVVVVGDEGGVEELATRKDVWEVVEEDGREGHLESAGRALAAVHQPGHSFACAQTAVHSVFHLQSDSTPRPMRICPSPSFASMVILVLPSKASLFYHSVCQHNINLFGLVRIVGMRRIHICSPILYDIVSESFVVLEDAFD
jgi:hypothetical protein